MHACPLDFQADSLCACWMTCVLTWTEHVSILIGPQPSDLKLQCSVSLVPRFSCSIAWWLCVSGAWKARGVRVGESCVVDTNEVHFSYLVLFGQQLVYWPESRGYPIYKFGHHWIWSIVHVYSWTLTHTKAYACICLHLHGIVHFVMCSLTWYV